MEFTTVIIVTMAKQNKFNMKGMEQKARKALENAVVEVGNTAKNFFVENFRISSISTMRPPTMAL